MTNPTKELIAARDDFIVGCHGCLDPEMEQTILSLLDSHINPPDLDELRMKLQQSTYEPATPLDIAYVDGYNAAIDRLSPRIVREGFVVVPEEPTEKQYIQYAKSCPPFTTYMFDEGKISAIWRNQSQADHVEACKKSYQAMIAASKGD